MKLSSFFAAGVIGAGFLLAPTSVRAQVIYTEGHADVGIALEEGDELYPHWHFHEGTILNGVEIEEDEEIDAGEAIARLDDSAKVTWGSNPLLSPIGILPGTEVWRISATETAGVPFLGFGKEGLGSEPVTLTLTGFSGPGNFSLYLINPDFELELYFQGFSNGTTANFGDASQYAQFVVPSHGHANWVFTEAGVYVLGLTWTTVNYGSVEGSFAFQVGVVPEPATWTLLAVSALALLGRHRRVTA